MYVYLMLRPVVTKACDCKCDRLRVRFPLEEMKYLIFLFLRSSAAVKRGVRFRRFSTRIAFRISESGEWSLLALGSLCLPCYMKIQLYFFRSGNNEKRGVEYGGNCGTECPVYPAISQI